jgi:hypothetical protein
VGSIVHKVVNGQTYYYLREMARVDGKPKMISQRYLGKAADMRMSRCLLKFGDDPDLVQATSA